MPMTRKLWKEFILVVARISVRDYTYSKARNYLWEFTLAVARINTWDYTTEEAQEFSDITFRFA